MHHDLSQLFCTREISTETYKVQAEETTYYVGDNGDSVICAPKGRECILTFHAYDPERLRTRLELLLECAAEGRVFSPTWGGTSHFLEVPYDLKRALSPRPLAALLTSRARAEMFEGILGGTYPIYPMDLRNRMVIGVTTHTHVGDILVDPQGKTALVVRSSGVAGVILND